MKNYSSKERILLNLPPIHKIKLFAYYLVISMNSTNYKLLFRFINYLKEILNSSQKLEEHKNISRDATNTDFKKDISASFMREKNKN